MFIRSRSEAPKLSRAGLESAVLLSGADAETQLTVTWVEVEPGGGQAMHSHPQEQVYVVVSGEGRVTVDGEVADLRPGDLVHIPGGAEHAIATVGPQPLTYVSAATPPIAIKGFYET